MICIIKYGKDGKKEKQVKVKDLDEAENIANEKYKTWEDIIIKRR